MSLGFATSDLGGRKCRILRGGLSLVAESVVFYMGADGVSLGFATSDLAGRKCCILHGGLSLVAESVVFYMGA